MAEWREEKTCFLLMFFKSQHNFRGVTVSGAIVRLGSISKCQCQSQVGAQESSLVLIKTTFYATIDEKGGIH